MDIWMNVVRYEALEKCVDMNIVPFAICLTENDKRNAKIDNYIDKHYGLTIDKRGYVCCVCNVILANKACSGKYKRIRLKDKTYKNIKKCIPVTSAQLDGKFIVDILFEDDSKWNSIELVETAIKEIDKGKVIVNVQ